MLPPLLDFIPVQPAYCLRTSVQPVSKVNGGEPDGSELIKKRPSGATSYRNADREPDNASLKQLSGVFCVGAGDKLDENACRDMPAGSYMVLPKGMHHFAVAKGDVVQVHGVGPFKIYWVR